MQLVVNSSANWTAITSQRFAWAEQDRRGEVFDSSAGFFLQNGARRSRGSAWVSRERLSGLANEAAVWHISPEFVIELKSASDRIATLREKMQEWIANGAMLGSLIDLESRTVEIYHANGPAYVLTEPLESAR